MLATLNNGDLVDISGAEIVTDVHVSEGDYVVNDKQLQKVPSSDEGDDADEEWSQSQLGASQQSNPRQVIMVHIYHPSLSMQLLFSQGTAARQSSFTWWFTKLYTIITRFHTFPSW